MYDINSPKSNDNFGIVSAYEKRKDISSLNINCNDQYFITSGFHDNVVTLYDVTRETPIQTFTNLHSQYTNVVRFANRNPNLFATSSFCREMKLWDLRDMNSGPIYTRKSTQSNIMVCFSPDDLYILCSAIDNEVRQYVTNDGRFVFFLSTLRVIFFIIQKSSHSYNIPNTLSGNPSFYIWGTPKDSCQSDYQAAF